MQSKSRDALLDNLKGVLIYLVVLAHFLQLGFRESNSFFQWLWVAIYSFHMPVFIFVSGYFSRREARGSGKTLHTLIIYYILGCVSVTLVKWATLGELKINHPFNPPFAMWYLMCIFFLRLLLPWIGGIRGGIIISIVVALWAGWSDVIGSTLTISRVLCLMPFFLMGEAWARQGTIQVLRKLHIMSKLGIVLLWAVSAFFFAVVMQMSGMNYDIVWVKCSYELGGMDPIFGMVARFSFLAVAFLTGVVLLMILPGKGCFLSKWGRNSVCVYLLHVVVFYLLRYLQRMYPLPELTTPKSLGLVMGVALVTVFILSRNFINWGIQALVRGLTRLTWREIQENGEEEYE